MRRFAVGILLVLSAAAAVFAQVETMGDVSFAVPDGWTYRRGAGFGVAAKTEGRNSWSMAVYAPMPSSGDTSNDLNAAWTRIVLAGNDYRGLPARPYYEVRGALGYPGAQAEDRSVSRTALTRMYVLETGKDSIPLIVVSSSRNVMDSMENIALEFLGSIREAPLRAQPVKNNISIADLVGHWESGAATSRDYYNRQTGHYEGNSTSFYGAAYTIAKDGSFAYLLSGKSNGSTVREQDSGVVLFGGEFVIFQGRGHVKKYRFINFQHSLDGAAVLTVLSENAEVSSLSIIKYGERWTRAAGGK